MIPVPKKVEILRIHKVALYKWDKVTDADAIKRRPTHYQVVIDDVPVAEYYNSYDDSAIDEVHAFIDGIAFAFKHYQTVLNFPNVTARDVVIRATK